jgi:thiol-disulfide isomerase/thioredoxin
MGKADRNRRQNAREKIAAQQAAARRAERRRQILLAGGSVAAVLIIVVAFIVIKSLNKPAAATGAATASGTTVTKVTADLAAVPAATLDKVGTGTTYSGAVQTIRTASTPLTQNGKPEIVYVGAEYCPYCAAERWALVTALSRFGTFSGLGLIHSSSTDVNPNTPTLTFYKSSYTSKYVVFQTTEAQTVTRATLQKLTALDSQLMSKYDVPPYVPTSTDNGSFPFVDFGNKYVIDGASFDPAILKGLTWTQISAALKDPSSPVAKGADGAANLITAAVCKITNGKPGSVCTSAGVKAASGAI